jgi:hypothetical protein
MNNGYLALGKNFLVKTDFNGNTVWHKTFNKSQNTSQGFKNVKLLIESNGDTSIILSGTGNYPGVSHHPYLMKLDTQGNIIWDYSYLNYSTTSYGYIPDGLFIINETIYIIGHELSVNIDSSAMFLFCIDKNGNFLWGKKYNTPFNSIGQGIIKSIDGNILITGNTDKNSNTIIGFNGIAGTNDGSFILTGGLKEQLFGEYDTFFAKFDSLGNFIWGNRIDGGGFEYGRKIFKASENEFFIYGETKSYPPGQNTLLISSDTLGQITWMKILQGLAFMTDIQYTLDGDYIIGGDGARIIKTDNLFNIIWQSKFGYFIGSNFKNLLHKEEGGYICYGSTSSDMYLVQTDSTGNGGCLNSNSIVSINPVSPMVFPFTLTDSLYSFTVDTNVIVNNINLQITTICFTGTDINEHIVEKKYLIYPNPAEAEIWIKFLEYQNISRIEISDVLGRTKSYLNKDVEVELRIDISEFNNGILFIKLYDNRNVYRVEKIVKL